MIVDDDVEGFLKFLDKVGLELACLLDIGDQQTGATGRGLSRQKISLTTKARTARSRAATKSNHRRTQLKSDRQQTRTKGRRKNKLSADELELEQEEDEEENEKRKEELIAETIIPSIECDGMEQMHHLSSSKHQHHSVQDLNQVSNKLHGINHHHLHQQQHQHLLHQQLDDPVGDPQPFVDSQLTTLSIAVDELVPPLDHGTSMSPSTHLSPLEASIQFNSGLHQQHYYPSQRMHLDSFHLQDEFSGHEQIPISASGSSPHLSGQDQLLQRHQHQLHQQHQRVVNSSQQQLMIRGQASVGSLTSILRSDVLGDNSTLSIGADCYSQGHTIHHHHQHQQQPQPQYQPDPHHQQQLQHAHHHHHQQSIDQQWLTTTGQHHNHHNHQHHQTPDSALQHLGASDSGPNDHVATLSPVAHQSLEQVQFTGPLYHPTYYNHQADQLDSFQQISDDYNANRTSLSANSSSPISGHLHRLQQENSQQQQQSASQAHVRMSTVNVINGSNNNNNNSSSNGNESSNGDTNEPTINQNPYDREHDHQHHHHHHHPMQPIHSQASDHQLHTLDTTYSGHHHHSHHQQLLHTHHLQDNHHAHHHQMMPLLNGLEPNGVIIQDINLASASWASPEDLYSI